MCDNYGLQRLAIILQGHYLSSGYAIVQSVGSMTLPTTACPNFVDMNRIFVSKPVLENAIYCAHGPVFADHRYCARVAASNGESDGLVIDGRHSGLPGSGKDVEGSMRVFGHDRDIRAADANIILCKR